MLKKIRKLHLYLGCIFAPLIMFFALSGLLMVLDLHKDLKSGYKAPGFIKYMDNIHTHVSNCSSKIVPTYCNLFEYSVIGMASGLILTAIFGIILAFKYNRNKKLVAGCLLLGIALPTILVLL